MGKPRHFDDLGRKITLYTKEDIYNMMSTYYNPLELCIELEFFGLL